MGLKVNGMDQMLKQIARMGRNAEHAKKVALENGAKTIQKTMERNSPDKDFTIVTSPVENDEIEIGPSKDDFTAHFFEFGTRAHKIEAKNKKVLSDGNTVYGPKVDHTGQLATPFIEPSFHQSKNQAKREMEKSLKRELGL
jgi:HK97 gp10 family phage protein